MKFCVNPVWFKHHGVESHFLECNENCPDKNTRETSTRFHKRHVIRPSHVICLKVNNSLWQNALRTKLAKHKFGHFIHFNLYLQEQYVTEHDASHYFQFPSSYIDEYDASHDIMPFPF